MQYVRLGRSGLKTSRIGLGVMSYGDPSGHPWALAVPAERAVPGRAGGAGVAAGSPVVRAVRLVGPLLAERLA